MAVDVNTVESVIYLEMFFTDTFCLCFHSFFLLAPETYCPRRSERWPLCPLSSPLGWPVTDGHGCCGRVADHAVWSVRRCVPLRGTRVRWCCGRRHLQLWCSGSTGTLSRCGSVSGWTPNSPTAGTTALTEHLWQWGPAMPASALTVRKGKETIETEKQKVEKTKAKATSLWNIWFLTQHPADNSVTDVPGLPCFFYVLPPTCRHIAPWRSTFCCQHNTPTSPMAEREVRPTTLINRTGCWFLSWSQQSPPPCRRAWLSTGYTSLPRGVIHTQKYQSYTRAFTSSGHIYCWVIAMACQIFLESTKLILVAAGLTLAFSDSDCKNNSSVFDILLKCNGWLKETESLYTQRHRPASVRDNVRHWREAELSQGHPPCQRRYLSVAIINTINAFLSSYMQPNVLYCYILLIGQVE